MILRKYTFGQWVEDFRWALNLARVRRIRREMGFLQRSMFDDALRRVAASQVAVAYPDALYYVTQPDVDRALVAAGLLPPDYGGSSRKRSGDDRTC